ncbi:hypothetical protein San01_42640 [Streptomyces angustmyceticus]|uniref:Uncharacterized protein n=1 Tax=Streptomyces angustmyceticus TaxID=285578 RepID=A0A5J4LBT8_9ACTN|nr:hypothetical protein San01_42640 [Streptomyces angustmyceticus]
MLMAGPDDWANFSPTNVAPHGVSAAVAFGDAGIALQTARPACDATSPCLSAVLPSGVNPLPVAQRPWPAGRWCRGRRVRPGGQLPLRASEFARTSQACGAGHEECVARSEMGARSRDAGGVSGPVRPGRFGAIGHAEGMPTPERAGQRTSPGALTWGLHMERVTGIEPAL